MPYEPNQAAQRIIRRAQAAGFTTEVDDEPHHMAYTVNLNSPDRVGRLLVGARSGRPLRISITNVHTTRNSSGSRVADIERILKELP